MPSRRSSQTKAVRIRGLTGKQHAFIREKVLGMNDKDAALAAGYSFPVAENT
jgi:phage terminase small subunit